MTGFMHLRNKRIRPACMIPPPDGLHRKTMNIKAGLCGSIYTQLSDVEDEINGLYTYDRKICKVNKEEMVSVAERIRQEIEKTGIEE